MGLMDIEEIQESLARRDHKVHKGPLAFQDLTERQDTKE
jgi:hypothetical protein